MVQDLIKKMKQKIGELCPKVEKKVREIVFWVKGIDTEEEVTRFLNIAGMVGIGTLVLLLTGTTIRYVVKQSNISHILRSDRGDGTKIEAEQKMIASEESTSKNSVLQKQYAQLVEQVQQLIQKDSLVETSETKDTLSDNRGIAGTNGKDGTSGSAGVNGKDGIQGKAGVNGLNGIDGANGKDGADGLNGRDGINGKDAYVQAVEAGYTGTEEEFAQTLSNVGVNLQEMTQKLIQMGEGLLTSQNHIDAVDNSFTSHVVEMQQKINEMYVNFQNGCNIISAAITAKGVDTPVNSTPNTMAEHINRLAEMQYKQGFADGAASNTAQGVEYEYHYHDGSAETGGVCFGEAEYHVHGNSCKGLCGNEYLDFFRDHKDGNGDRRYDYACSSCNYNVCIYVDKGRNYKEKHYSATPTCGMNDNQLLGYRNTCGRSDGEIISATIKY